MVFNHASEALYAVAVSDKTAQPWLVDDATRAVEELCYGGMNISTTMYPARDLQDLRRHASSKRSTPTVPPNASVRESKGKGAGENVVRRWQGQFRTFKSHVETQIGSALPRDHPVLQWMAVWAAGVPDRVPIRSQ